jgi:hypothetical protein
MREGGITTYVTESAGIHIRPGCRKGMWAEAVCARLEARVSHDVCCVYAPSDGAQERGDIKSLKGRFGVHILGFGFLFGFFFLLRALSFTTPWLVKLFWRAARRLVVILSSKTWIRLLLFVGLLGSVKLFLNSSGDWYCRAL